MLRPGAKSKGLLAVYSKLVTLLVFLLLIVAGLGIMVMMLIICVDVVLRKFGSPLVGTFDIVRIAATISIAAALPYTTAVKGHVAIEYFFQKLSRRGRLVVDTIARLLGMALFGILCWESIQYGISMKQSGQVTMTLQIPIYWVLYVIAFCCAAVVLVILHNLLHPGKEMIKP